MKRGRPNKLGGCCAAFGAGVLIAMLFPPKWILIFAAVWLVLLGTSCVRCR